MTTNLQDWTRTWDLESWFAGGSDSQELLECLETLENELPRLTKAIVGADTRAGKPQLWKDIVDQLQDTALKLRNTGAFVSCLAFCTTVPALNASLLNSWSSPVIGQLPQGNNFWMRTILQ